MATVGNVGWTICTEGKIVGRLLYYLAYTSHETNPPERVHMTE